MIGKQDNQARKGASSQPMPQPTQDKKQAKCPKTGPEKKKKKKKGQQQQPGKACHVICYGLAATF